MRFTGAIESFSDAVRRAGFSVFLLESAVPYSLCEAEGGGLFSCRLGFSVMLRSFEVFSPAVREFFARVCFLV